MWLTAWLQQAVDFMVGYDYFISYAHLDGKNYASTLELRLRELGYRVFLDRQVYVAGTDLDRATLRRVRMSRYLVVLATPVAMKSAWVAKEVEACLASGRTPLLIDINGSFRESAEDLSLKKTLRNFLHIADVGPEPSPMALSELAKSFKATRQERLRLQLAVVAAIVFAAATITATVQSVAASRARDLAKHQAGIADVRRVAALSQLSRPNYPQRSLLLAAESAQRMLKLGTRLPEVEQALREALSSCHGYGHQGAHMSTVQLVKVSPDGRRAATADDEENVRFWDLGSRPEEHKSIELKRRPRGRVTHLDGSEGPSYGSVDDLLFSHDGRWLVAKISHGEEAEAWDLEQHPIDEARSLEIGHLGRFNDRILAMNFAREHLLIVNSRGEILRWDLARQSATVITLNEGNRPPDSLNAIERLEEAVLSPDSGWLVTRGAPDKDPRSRCLRLWRIRDDSIIPVMDLRCEAIYVEEMVFSPDGRYFAVSGTSTEKANAVLIWSLSGPSLSNVPAVLAAHQIRTDRLAFSPDGRWLAGAGSHSRDQSGESVFLWNVSAGLSGAPRIELPGRQEWIWAATFSPDSRWLAVTGTDRSVQLWELPSGASRPAQNLLQGHEAAIHGAAAFFPDSRWLVSGSGDGDLRFWDLSSLNTPGDVTILPRGAPLKWIVFTPDGHHIITGEGQGKSSRTSGPTDAIIWDLLTHQSGQRLKSHSGGIDFLTLSSDGQRLITAGDDQVLDWDVSDLNAKITPIQLEHAGIESISLDARGRWLVTLEQQGVTRVRDLWQQSIPQMSLEVPPATAKTTAVAARPEGLVTGHANSEVHLWRVTPDAIVSDHVLGSCGGEVRLLEASGDGRWIAAICGRDKYVHLWDASAQRAEAEGAKLQTFQYDIHTVAFSPNGYWLAAGGGDSSVYVWDLRTQDPTASMRLLRGHGAAVKVVRFSPDSRRIATGAQDGVVRVWQMEGELLSPVEFSGSGSEITDISFSSDGQLMGAVELNGSIRIWQQSLEVLLRNAKLAAGRNLRGDEWRYSFGGEQYNPTFADFPSLEKWELVDYSPYYIYIQ